MKTHGGTAGGRASKKNDIVALGRATPKFLQNIKEEIVRKEAKVTDKINHFISNDFINQNNDGQDGGDDYDLENAQVYDSDGELVPQQKDKKYNMDPGSNKVDIQTFVPKFKAKKLKDKLREEEQKEKEGNESRGAKEKQKRKDKAKELLSGMDEGDIVDKAKEQKEKREAVFTKKRTQDELNEDNRDSKEGKQKQMDKIVKQFMDLNKAESKKKKVKASLLSFDDCE